MSATRSRKTSNKLRYLTVADNGDIYAKTQFGGLIALRSTKGDGRADDIEKFGTGGGTGIALWHGWLYESTTTGVYRYKMTPGQLVPSGEPETIISGLPAGKQHDAKNFVFSNDGQLYVEVGSPLTISATATKARSQRVSMPLSFCRLVWILGLIQIA